MFSILDATPIYRIGAPPLVAVKSATINGRSISPFFVRPFWDTVGGGVPTARGIGRHPSMPSAWIGLIGSNLLASTVIALLRTSLSNRTGRGTSHVARERFILPIKPARRREFNPFHRKHHGIFNASSERRSNKIVGCPTIPFLFSRVGRIRLNG